MHNYRRKTFRGIEIFLKVFLKTAIVCNLCKMPPWNFMELPLSSMEYRWSYLLTTCISLLFLLDRRIENNAAF